MTDYVEAGLLVLFDECECGDYRRDHYENVGRCSMPNDLCHGFDPCLAFRLYKQAVEIPGFFKKPPGTSWRHGPWHD